MDLSSLFLTLLLSKNFVFNLFLEIIFMGLSLIFFEKILKLRLSNTNQFIYILTNGIYFSISAFLGKYIYSYPLILANSIILCIFLLKISVLKTFTFFSLQSILILNIHFCLYKIFSMFSVYDSYFEMIEAPICGIITIFSSLIIGIILFFTLRHFKDYNLFIKAIHSNFNLVLSVSVLNLIIAFSSFFLLFETFRQNSFYMILLDLYFYFSISHILYLCSLLHMKQKINNLKLCNKSILTMYDDTRAFKHDFHNIIQAIGGYILTNDLDGLKKYYAQISADCKTSVNLSKLNPQVINNPAIYSILADKYYIASNHQIQLNIDVMLDLNTINMKIYELTRIMGILLDNAIEASKECTQKSINMFFKKDKYKQMIIIENTYNNKEISLDKIFEKDYSTKPHNSGLGLWEVRKILNKNSNLNLHTSKNEDYFSQQLEIYHT